jgi:predicted RecA/RadA family phage recombinase
MLRVTEGIFEYPKTVTKWARNGSKKSIFRARTARTVQNAVALSRDADFAVIG